MTLTKVVNIIILTILDNKEATMTKVEQEGMRRAFQKAYNNGNQRWNFNGRTFETRMEVYRSHVWISAYFESSVEEVTVWMSVGRAFRQMVNVDGPRKTFRGKNSLISALNYLSDCYLQTIQKVQELEREALKQVVPQISAEAFREIFGSLNNISA